MGILSNLGSVFDPMHHFIPKEYDSSGEPQATAQEGQLLDTSKQLYSQAGAFEPLVKLRLAQLADPSKQIARSYGRANADTAQQLPSLSTATPFQRAMMRGSALTRIGLMGENQIRQQNLRDRISTVRLGTALQSGRNRELSDAANRQAEAEAARSRSMQDIYATTQNVGGTIIGAGLRSFADPNRFGRNNSTNANYGGTGPVMDWGDNE